jgi:hypothetical protein
MAPHNGWMRLRRQVLFTLAPRFPRFRRFVNSGTLAQPHRYIASPLVQPPATSPAVGTFAADADMLVAGRPTKLRELLGHGFTFVYVGERPPATAPILGHPRAALGPLPLSALVVIVGTPPAPTPHDPTRQPLLAQATAAILRHYESGRWHLVRPDMHIASVFDARDDAAFNRALREASQAHAGITLAASGVPADADPLPA